MDACKPVMESLQDRDGMASTEDSQTEFSYVDDLLLNLDNNNNSSMDSHLGITDYDSTCEAGHQGQSHRSEMIHPLEESFPGADIAVSRCDQKDLGLLFDWCIREVSRLQTQRDELIGELRQEPMVRAVKHLRGKLEETRRLLALVQLDYIAVHEEVQQVKRKLFSNARDCIRSQVTLGAQEYEVAQSTVTQEELNCQIEGLTQELLQLREAHRNQVNALRDRARAPSSRPRTMSDVSHCRRTSVSLQRRLSGSMRALEGWYEPRVMTLLKRQQFVEEALRRNQELGRDLKFRLGPLREETQKLGLQKASLEQRIYLMEREREENITQYKETVGTLEEILRELKNEFKIQRASKKHLQELKDGLSRELVFLRGCDEPSETTEL